MVWDAKQHEGGYGRDHGRVVSVTKTETRCFAWKHGYISLKPISVLCLVVISPRILRTVHAAIIFTWYSGRLTSVNFVVLALFKVERRDEGNRR